MCDFFIQAKRIVFNFFMLLLIFLQIYEFRTNQ